MQKIPGSNPGGPICTNFGNIYKHIVRVMNMEKKISSKKQSSIMRRKFLAGGKRFGDKLVRIWMQNTSKPLDKLVTREEARKIALKEAERLGIKEKTAREVFVEGCMRIYDYTVEVTKSGPLRNFYFYKAAEKYHTRMLERDKKKLNKLKGEADKLEEEMFEYEKHLSDAGKYYINRGIKPSKEDESAYQEYKEYMAMKKKLRKLKREIRKVEANIKTHERWIKKARARYKQYGNKMGDSEEYEIKNTFSNHAINVSEGIMMGTYYAYRYKAARTKAEKAEVIREFDQLRKVAAKKGVKDYGDAALLTFAKFAIGHKVEYIDAYKANGYRYKSPDAKEEVSMAEAAINLKTVDIPKTIPNMPANVKIKVPALNNNISVNNILKKLTPKITQEGIVEFRKETQKKQKKKTK